MRTSRVDRRLLAWWITALTLVLCVCPLSSFAQQRKSDEFVLLDTSKGQIVIRVAYSIVPYTAGNFLDLVQRGFYDGLSFHRVEGWVVQGGDPRGNGSGSFIDPDTGRPRLLQLETNRLLTHNQPGMVAMARSADRNSASCQFYILKRAMPQLNGQYAVFGKVVQGMNVVYALNVGDRILSARIAEHDSSQPRTTGSAADGGRPATAPPTGDSGF